MLRSAKHGPSIGQYLRVKAIFVSCREDAGSGTFWWPADDDRGL